MKGRQALHTRGLTLIEVLLSIVLLGVLVGSGASVLRDIQASARRSEDEAGDSLAIVELGLLADRFMHDPAAFGVESLTHLGTGRQIPWRNGTGRGAVGAVGVVGITQLRPDDSADENVVKHCWIAFTWEDVTVMRWAPLPEESEERGPDG